MGKAKNALITIRIERDLLKQVEQIAGREFASTAHTIRRLIRTGIEHEPVRVVVRYEASK